MEIGAGQHVIQVLDPDRAVGKAAVEVGRARRRQAATHGEEVAVVAQAVAENVDLLDVPDAPSLGDGGRAPGHAQDDRGEEADERFYYGAESRKITTLTKNKDGKSTKKKSNKNHIPENASPMIYSRIFDETNKNWSPDSDMSEWFLRSVQKMMNDQLYGHGHVMLNYVYKSLGFAESPEGAVVGWSQKVPGDDFVSFGLDNDINQRPGDNRWMLDFNVNGVVFYRIGER